VYLQQVVFAVEQWLLVSGLYTHSHTVTLLLLLLLSQMTGLCAADLFHANMVAREMILSAGMGRKIGEQKWGFGVHNVGSKVLAGGLGACLEIQLLGQRICCT
jgi:hypothetical protein